MRIQSLKFAIPVYFVWMVIIACLLPVLFNIAGVDFGNIAIDKRRFLHNTLEILAVSVALLTVILSFVDFRIKGDVSTPIVAFVLFCSAFFDLIHIMAANSLILQGHRLTFITIYTWIFSRTFNALILLIGAGLFLKQSDNLFRNVKRHTMKFLLYVFSVLILISLCFLIFVVDLDLKSEQQLFGLTINRTLDIIPLILYLFSLTIIFPKFYSNHPSIFSQTLLVSLIPSIAGQLHVIFGSHAIGDNHFMIASYDKFISYLVPFLGISLNYLQTHQNEKKVIEILRHESRENYDLNIKLKELLDDLNRSNKELEQFAYVASHDLQEPLRKITSFGDRLKLKYNELLPEEGKDYVNRMFEASLRMQKLISELLAFSRISSQSEPFQYVDLNTLFKNILNDVDLKVQNQNAEIQMENLPVIDAIPSQIQQLFQNLILNSLKFHKPEVAPVIKIRSDIINRNKPNSTNSSRKFCKITMEDNGIGFDEQDAEKIFVLFQRLHGRSDYEGTGIGLAICKKIVENHQGTICATGKENNGATFIVELPLKQT